MTELLSTEVGRHYNAWAALIVLALWTINGVVFADERRRLDNVITLLIGAVFFGIAAGSWSAAHEQDPALRVSYFSALLSAIVVALGWRVVGYFMHGSNVNRGRRHDDVD